MKHSSDRLTLVGAFEDRQDAEAAINALAQAGIPGGQIGLARRETAEPDAPEEETADQAVTGALAGGSLGAAAALLIPGIGPAIAGGVLATTLGTAAAGAAVGSIVGVLTDEGLPAHEAEYFQNEFEAGRAIVTVRARNAAEFETAASLLHDYGAVGPSPDSPIETEPPVDQPR